MTKYAFTIPIVKPTNQWSGLLLVSRVVERPFLHNFKLLFDLLCRYKSHRHTLNNLRVAMKIKQRMTNFEKDYKT